MLQKTAAPTVEYAKQISLDLKHLYHNIYKQMELKQKQLIVMQLPWLKINGKYNGVGYKIF